MIATFTALLFAHFIADFVLQTNWIHRNKRNFGVLVLHGALVLATAQMALGQFAVSELLILAAAHLLIDAIKTYGGFNRLTAFLVDQAAHLAIITTIAFLAPSLWATGLWSKHDWILPLFALATGAITALIAGQYAVGLLMRPHGNHIRNNGLRDGGRLIGMLERGLIFVLILLGQPLGVGFLVAAKSILRFGTATRDQRTAEYVIIGTLASFGWAILASYATLALINLLPPLEIARILP